MTEEFPVRVGVGHTVRIHSLGSVLRSLAKMSVVDFGLAGQYINLCSVVPDDLLSCCFLFGVDLEF